MWLTCPLHPEVKEMWLTMMHNTYLDWVLLRMHSFQTLWTMWLWSLGGIFLDRFGLCIVIIPPSWDPRWLAAFGTPPLSPEKQAQLEHRDHHRCRWCIGCWILYLPNSHLWSSVSSPSNNTLCKDERILSTALPPHTTNQLKPTCLGLWDSLCFPKAIDMINTCMPPGKTCTATSHPICLDVTPLIRKRS